MRRLADEGKHYFLSRPRRSGKSLLNLTDITLDSRHPAVCGYTDADLDTVFAPELPGLDRKAIRDRYNGCNWRGEEGVYNPFDILLLFRDRELDAYRFEAGTPSFLIELPVT